MQTLKYRLDLTDDGLNVKAVESEEPLSDGAGHFVVIKNPADSKAVVLMVDHMSGKTEKLDTLVTVGAPVGAPSIVKFPAPEPGLEKKRKGEIMVFAAGRLPAVIPFDANSFANGVNELTVELQPPKAIDVCVWLVCGDPPSDTSERAVNRQRERALRHIAYANAVLRVQEAGFWLRVPSEDHIIDIVKPVADRKSILLSRFSWGDIAQFNEQIAALKDVRERYCDGMVNIFYTEDIGRRFGDGQTGTDDFARQGMIVLGNRALDDLLLHEFGHLSGLGHTDEAPLAGGGEFDSQNCMFGRSIDRCMITDGQLARMHFGLHSVLNTLYDLHPLAQRRTCLDTMYSPQCLRLGGTRRPRPNLESDAVESCTFSCKTGADAGAPLSFSTCAFSTPFATTTALDPGAGEPNDCVTARGLKEVLCRRALAVIGEINSSSEQGRKFWPDAEEVEVVRSFLTNPDGKDGYYATEANRYGISYKQIADVVRLPFDEGRFPELVASL